MAALGGLNRCASVAALALALALAGCATAPAPVFEIGRGTAPQQAQRSEIQRVEPARAELGQVRVERGDTLYGIAFRHGLDWRALAEWNGISAPYTIFPGQLLRLGPQQTVSAALATAPTTTAPASAAAQSPPQRVQRDPQSGVEVYAIDSSLSELPLAPVETVVTVDVAGPEPVAAPRPAAAASGGGMAQAGSTASTPVLPLSGSPAAQRAAQARAERVEAGAAEAAAAPEGRADLAQASAAPPPAAAPSVAPASASAPAATQTVAGLRWQWPARGEIVRRFAASESGRRGIQIAGRAGDPVVAAADGEVVYSGNGLVGYGELIIIKHSPTLLSAYGHNRVRLVEQGQSVRAGQQIAELGRSGTDRDILHFEIRQNGQPVDPMRFLPPR